MDHCAERRSWVLTANGDLPLSAQPFVVPALLEPACPCPALRGGGWKIDDM